MLVPEWMSREHSQYWTEKQSCAPLAISSHRAPICFCDLDEYQRLENKRVGENGKRGNMAETHSPRPGPLSFSLLSSSSTGLGQLDLLLYEGSSMLHSSKVTFSRFCDTQYLQWDHKVWDKEPIKKSLTNTTMKIKHFANTIVRRHTVHIQKQRGKNHTVTEWVYLFQHWRCSQLYGDYICRFCSCSVQRPPWASESSDVHSGASFPL